LGQGICSVEILYCRNGGEAFLLKTLETLERTGNTVIFIVRWAAFMDGLDRALGTMFNRRKWLSYADAIVVKIYQTSFPKMTLIEAEVVVCIAPMSVSYVG
jgi:hypothetical protein